MLETYFIGHVRHSLQLFNLSSPEATIDTLFLAGDFAVIPTLASLIATRLNIATKIANPLSRMQVAAAIEPAHLHAVAPLLTLCCGLALQVTA